MKRIRTGFFLTVALVLSLAYSGNIGICHAEQKKNSSQIEITMLLQEDDFTVTGGQDRITLDDPFREFKTAKKEKSFELVGWVAAGRENYKYIVHMYPGFQIVTSNENFGLKNRKFDDRYISVIMLGNGSDYKTARGLAVGSSMQEILDAYGNGYRQMVQHESGLVIEYGTDKVLRFFTDKEQKVTIITLLVIVQNADKDNNLSDWWLYDYWDQTRYDLRLQNEH